MTAGSRIRIRKIKYINCEFSPPKKHEVEVKLEGIVAYIQILQMSMLGPYIYPQDKCFKIRIVR